MKCWKSTFNAQGSKLIMVALQVRTMNIYATIVKVLKKKERQGEIKL